MILTTREALAKALHDNACADDDCDGSDFGGYEGDADDLFASGAVIDAATLADDEAEARVPCHVSGCVDHVDGMHADSLGDAIWHVGCDACTGEKFTTARHWEPSRGVSLALQGERERIARCLRNEAHGRNDAAFNRALLFAAGCVLAEYDRYDAHSLCYDRTTCPRCSRLDPALAAALAERGGDCG